MERKKINVVNCSQNPFIDPEDIKFLAQGGIGSRNTLMTFGKQSVNACGIDIICPTSLRHCYLYTPLETAPFFEKGSVYCQTNDREGKCNFQTERRK